MGSKDPTSERTLNVCCDLRYEGNVCFLLLVIVFELTKLERHGKIKKAVLFHQDYASDSSLLFL